MALHRAGQADTKWLVEIPNGRFRNARLNEHLFRGIVEGRVAAAHTGAAVDPSSIKYEATTKRPRVAAMHHAAPLQGGR
jgi:hypothetical protein